ncbi:MAG: hypothetical protein WA055_05165 [Candidatus Moraniibacteriota bacterium]
MKEKLFVTFISTSVIASLVFAIFIITNETKNRIPFNEAPILFENPYKENFIVADENIAKNENDTLVPSMGRVVAKGKNSGKTVVVLIIPYQKIPKGSEIELAVVSHFHSSNRFDTQFYLVGKIIKKEHHQ